MPGVLGADLAASDLSHFLNKQRVTPTSVSFIFTRSGEIVAFPDKARVAALVARSGEMMVSLPKLTELNEPAAAGLFAAYQASGVSGTLVNAVADRTYIGRIVEIAVRYGARPAVGDRRADRRDPATNHRIAQPDAFLFDCRPGLCAAGWFRIS
jgi:hypothetical protein